MNANNKPEERKVIEDRLIEKPARTFDELQTVEQMFRRQLSLKRGGSRHQTEMKTLDHADIQ